MRHRSPSRGLAALLSLALVLGMGAVVTVASPPAPAAAATGTLSLDHDATPATVLAGENARIALEARHAGASEEKTGTGEWTPASPVPGRGLRRPRCACRTPPG